MENCKKRQGPGSAGGGIAGAVHSCHTPKSKIYTDDLVPVEEGNLPMAEKTAPVEGKCGYISRKMGSIILWEQDNAKSGQDGRFFVAEVTKHRKQWAKIVENDGKVTEGFT